MRRETTAAYLAELSSWHEVEQAMAKLNLAWGKVRDPADIRNQETVAHRGAIVDVDDREGGTRPVTQSPYRFSAARSGVRGPAPHRGEHNVEALRDWLGKTPEQVSALEAAGVLSSELPE